MDEKQRKIRNIMKKAQPPAQGFSPESASMSWVIPSPEFRMRAYFSSYHLWAAKHFAGRAKEIEEAHSGPPTFDITHRAYVMGAIVESVSFLEGAINEILEDASIDYRSYLGKLSDAQVLGLRQSWKKMSGGTSPTNKYKFALTSLGIPEPAAWKKLTDEAQVVVILRNHLTHYVPKSVGGRSKFGIENKLDGKFEGNRLTGSRAGFFPDDYLGCGCAAWAHESAQALADTFFAASSITPNYQRVNF